LVNTSLKTTLFQVGLTQGRRTVDNIFIIKTSVDKYLKAERGSLCWCFVDFEKAFDSIDRETLLIKMREIGVNENVLNCTQIMCQDIKFCVKCGENLISSCATQNKGVHQGRGFSPY
jgi:hypothetical protein